MKVSRPRASSVPFARRWTRAEYYKMGEAGFFLEQRVELMGGEILVHGRQTWPHALTCDKVYNVLREFWPAGHWVRIRAPLVLADDSEPEPDVSVVRGSIEDFTDHPTTALLILEVSDSTWDYDRGPKASLCAAAGITDYWIANLQDGQLEVYRDPVPDSTQDFGFRYATVAILQPGATVSPLAAPLIQIPVADLLP